MAAVEDESTIEIRRGEKPVLVYNKAPTAEAAENEPHYTRTGYIHPVYSPSGKVVSGDYAADHPHQHGLFFAWTKTSFEGRKPEFWNQKQKSGRISYRRTLALVNEGSVAGFDVEHLWEDLTAPEGAKPVLIEVWKVRAKDAGEKFFAFEIESVQRCAGESPLTVERYHYGGMAFRGNDGWLGEKGTPPGKMITSEDLGREEGNHTRPEWVALHGPVDGERAGIQVRSDPGNFRHPQWVRLHPDKPYFVFAPMVEEAFRIEPGKEYRSKFHYRVYDVEFEF